MLKQGDESITEISDALGFNEVSYFNQFFKKRAGTSPLKYRQS
jgi:AraC-like DNA-binding protein